MIQKVIFIIIFTFFFTCVSAELQITELMYNPSSEMGSDTDLEWVEVYNKEEITFNLSDYTINGKTINDVEINPFSYLVIARELTDGSDADNDSFSNFYFETNATDAGAFTLSNTAGEVLISNGEINITVSYLDDFGGDGNGHSLELINGTWLESKEKYGTPGRKNTAEEEKEVIKSGLKLESYLKEDIYTSYNYNRLFKIKFLGKDNCSAKEEINISYVLFKKNELVFESSFSKMVGCSTYSNTGSLFLEEEGEYLLCGHSTIHESNQLCYNLSVIDVSKIPCDLSIDVLTEKLVYESGEKIGYYNSLNEERFPYYIEYWVEDFLGEVFKKKVQTTNTNKKSYTPKIEEIDRALLIKAKVYPFCADLNFSNNEDEQLIIIVKTVLEEEDSVSMGEDSKIEITKISPEEQKFSGLIKAEVEIYKGSTGKYSISAYAEKDGKKISPITKINLKNKYVNYKLTLPIQLILNCEGKVSPGKAKVVVEGLGVNDDKSFEVSGADDKICKTSVKYEEQECKETKCEQIKEKSSLPLIFNTFGDVEDIKTNHNYESEGMVVYESSSSKAKNILPYLILFSSALLILIIFKRK
jgi:hypothetical protein